MRETVELIQLFREVFHTSPEGGARAPGRVNLIGEHLDYNGGPVLPVAIEREFRVLGRRRNDGRFRLFSTRFQGVYETERPFQRTEDPFWVNYPLGVIRELDESGVRLEGLEIFFSSDVPVGSGLSSSAAIEVSTAMLVLALAEKQMSPLEVAQLCQQADHRFVGVQSGLMDQAASACCRKGEALLLDCSIPAFERVRFPADILSIVVAHCGVSRTLALSEYNTRRAQCEEALEGINRLTGKNAPHLCAVSLDVFEQVAEQLPEAPRKRARHVISETQRVGDFIVALQEAQLETLGAILNAGHASLREDYEVSSAELDRLTALSRGFDGVYGARLTGAGFGGCTVSLVQPEKEEALLAHLRREYYEKNGLEPLCFACRPEDGAGTLDLANLLSGFGTI